ncbi:hypothetical protein MKMG_01822 [Methanogenium sp. MK-MG]|nr:hypothetical protein MKMG_01822 [Methanogenium sp. MK-MG]
MTGVRREEIAGKGNYAYSEAIYGEKRPILIDLVLNPVLSIKDDYHITSCEDGYFTAEKKVVLSDGRKHDIWVKVSPMVGENNEFSGAIASLRDITSKKKAEDKIRQANEYNRCLIEAHVDPLVTIDERGTIIDFNEAMEKLTGYTHDFLTGMCFFDLFTEPGKAREVHERVMGGTRLMDVPLQVRTAAAGQEFGILFFGSPYISGNGDVQGVFAELHDVLSLPGAEREMLCRGKELQKCVSDGWQSTPHQYYCER